MDSIDETLEQLGLSLPAPTPPVGTYVGAAERDGLLFVSGHGPYRDGGWIYRGKLESTITVAEAREAAKLTTLNALSSARAALGSLDRVERVLKVFGMVNADPSFEAHPTVIDAASDLLVEIFGDQGRHTRAAVGMASLPFGIAVEIEMILAVR